MRFQKFISLIIISFVCTACASTDSTISNSDVEFEIQSDLALERPIPYPIDIPDAYLQAIERGTRTANGEPGESYWQNFASYDLYAELDPENQMIYGSSVVNYQNNSPDHLDVIVVELAQNLHKEGTPKMDVTEITGGINLTKVMANGIELNIVTMAQRWTQGAAGYTIEGTQLYIFPNEILYSGESMNFEFEWSFVVPEAGASGRMGRSRGNLYFIAYWYPHISVYDDLYGWFYDSFTGNAEFYHGFADYNLTVTAPREWLIMGTGEFINPEETLSEDTLERYLNAGESDETTLIADFDELADATLESEEGKLTWKFEAEKVRDVAFSATLESRWEGARTPVGDLSGDGEIDFTRINTFYRESAPFWQSQTEYAQHSISFLSDYMQIPYPWPHMSSVEGADIIGGGMEFPMMTIIGDYNSAGATRLYGVTAHELAHMWFPMILSTNERRYTWIDEGYTSFHTSEANIDYYGADQFDQTDVFGQYLQIAGSDYEGEIMRWSDFHYPGPAYGVASYPKPASVLYALRGVLGEEKFMEAHLELIDRWKYKHPYPWDIFNTIEDVAREDLSWFWRAWLYETWVLDQSVAGVNIEGGKTVVEIRDLGNIPMPVLLRLTYEDGSVVDERIPVTHWLNGFRTYEYEVPDNRLLIKVEIDPDRLFPDTDRFNNVWE